MADQRAGSSARLNVGRRLLYALMIDCNIMFTHSAKPATCDKKREKQSSAI